MHRGRRSRLRQRIAREGLREMEPWEILEFLLYYADARGDTNPTAHLLVERFGSVEAALSAPEAELLAVKGVGPKAAKWLKLVGRLALDFQNADASQRPRLNTLKQARAFAAQRLWPLGEGVYQLSLSRNGSLQLMSRVGDKEVWGEGGCLRAALEDALGVQAHSAVLIKVDARGSCAQYDIDHAFAYAEALTAAEIRFTDLLICARDSCTSLAFEGSLAGLSRPGPDDLLSRGYLQEE